MVRLSEIRSEKSYLNERKKKKDCDWFGWLCSISICDWLDSTSSASAGGKDVHFMFSSLVWL